MWPSFPLRCGAFTLHDFKHAEKEAEKIKMLKLGIIPKRQYNPKSVAYNVTSQAKIAKFHHEKDIYDDSFSSDEVFSQVKQLEKIKIGAEGLEEFYKFRTQRLEMLPLDLLNTTSVVKLKGQSEGKISEQTPEKERTPEREQAQEGTNDPLDTNIYIHPNSIKEWEQFDSIINKPNKSQELTMPKMPTVKMPEVITVPIGGTSGLPRIQ